MSKELTEKELQFTAGGKYDDRAYPGGVCPDCGKGILHEDAAPYKPCRILICNNCGQDFDFD